MKRLKFPKSLNLEWDNLDVDLWKERLPEGLHKFFEREKVLRYQWQTLSTWIPEYLSSSQLKFLDVSAGSGATLELIRCFGHIVKGTDFTNNYKYANCHY